MSSLLPCHIFSIVQVGRKETLTHHLKSLARKQLCLIPLPDSLTLDYSSKRSATPPQNAYQGGQIANPPGGAFFALPSYRVCNLLLPPLAFNRLLLCVCRC